MSFSVISLIFLIVFITVSCSFLFSNRLKSFLCQLFFRTNERAATKSTALWALQSEVIGFHVLTDQLLYLVFQRILAGLAEMQADHESRAAALHNQPGRLRHVGRIPLVFIILHRHHCIHISDRASLPDRVSSAPCASP